MGKALKLKVTDKDSMVVGSVIARVGLRTKAGVITRMTDKTIWCLGKSGHENMYRDFDGKLPAVFKSYAGKFCSAALSTPTSQP